MNLEPARHSPRPIHPAAFVGCVIASVGVFLLLDLGSALIACGLGLMVSTVDR